MFKKRTIDEDELIEFIMNKLKGTDIAKEEVVKILDYELDYLIKVGIAKSK